MTNSEALEMALTLAITAPTDQESSEAIAIAQQIAGSMEDHEVEAIKAKIDKAFS